MGIVVKNLRGTSELSCKCGTWLRHWERGSGRSAAICWVSGCAKSPDAGAHVKKVGTGDEARYIVPMCQAHNMTDETLTLSDGAPLVPANKQKTCG
jgi:hypothetical protein